MFIMKWASLAFVIADALIVLIGVGLSIMCMEPGTADAGQCIAFSTLFIVVPVLVFLVPGAILHATKRHIAAMVVCAVPIAALVLYFLAL